MVRFAAVAAEVGNTRIPYTGARGRGAHRKRPASSGGGFSSELSRRRFLGALAAATVAGVGAARLVVDPQPRTFAQVPAALVPTSGPTAPAALLPPPPPR